MAAVDMLRTRARRVDLVAVDVTVAMLLGVIFVVQEASVAHPGVIPLLAGPASAATVAWRRRVPVVMTVTAAVCVGLLVWSGGNTDLVPIVIVLNVYMLGRRSAERGWAQVEALLLVLAVPALAFVPGNSRVVDFVSVWAFFVALPFASGRVIGSRGAATQELQADTDRLESAERERARRAISDERTRIARELHDVVAHSVSVMVIQTAAARRLAGQDRKAAREALRSVASCGRDALSEMRRMVGVLHRGDLDLTGAMGGPGLAQLHTLAERARASGLPVDVHIEGEPRPLSATLDLVAFRVVQEALTNVIKHAGPARASVRVAYTARALELEVVDTGRGPGTVEAGPEAVGHGLVGMQERLAHYGGELRTGRCRGGGFQVRARVPLSEAVAA
jgi:signal transduction histidine kinase